MIATFAFFAACDCQQRECPEDQVWSADLCRCDLSALVLPDTLGPILGAVTDQGARIWVRAPQASYWRIDYQEKGTSSGSSAFGEPLEAATDFTGVIDINGLFAATSYEYDVVVNGMDFAAGTFRTLPPVGSPSRLRFVVSSDLNPEFFDAFDAVRASEPDFMLLIGDQIYADWPDSIPPYAKYYRRLYRQVFSEGRMAQALREISTYMIWDDHEISNNYERGPNTQRYRSARIAYDEYQGSHNPPPRAPSELYYSFEAGQLEFFVLDTRSYRSPKETSDPSAKSMLGPQQWEDLLGWLSSSTARLKFIVSSVPFHPWTRSPTDSWSRNGFPIERDRLFAFIRDQKITGVVLISGDQHWAGVFRFSEIGFPGLYEFQCSPLAVDVQPGPAATHEDILFVDNHRGFGLFEVDTTVSPARLDFSWIDRRGVVQYQLPLTESDIHAQTLAERGIPLVPSRR